MPRARIRVVRKGEKGGKPKASPVEKETTPMQTRNVDTAIRYRPHQS